MDIEELVKLTSGIFDRTELPLRVKDSHYSFKLDNRAKHSLNKTLDSDFIAVYRQEEDYIAGQWGEGKLDWSTERVYVVTKRGNVVMFTNSEWACFEKVKK